MGKWGKWMTVLGSLLLLAAAAPEAASRVELREWPVPWKDTRPRDPAVDREGRVWFVGQQGDYVGWFDPATEKFGRFPLDPGSGPHNLIVAATSSSP